MRGRSWELTFCRFFSLLFLESQLLFLTFMNVNEWLGIVYPMGLGNREKESFFFFSFFVKYSRNYEYL